MSAQFPNVPNLPGVPAVAKPTAQLRGMLVSATDSFGAAQSALTFVGAGNTGSAGGALNLVVSSATNALGLGLPIFPETSAITGALSGTIGNASNALSALTAGDITGAVSSIEQTVDAARSAVDSLRDILNPEPLDALTGSGSEVNADTAQQWGLFTQDGDPVAPADNVIAFANSLEARISDYPVAPGAGGSSGETVGFASYNKVIVPYDIRLVMSRGGTVEDRQDFLKAIQDAWQSTELYNVVTPECVYLDVNVVGVRREATSDRGMGLLALEISLRKVRQTASLTFTTTAEPSGAGQVKDGSVQARPASPPTGTIH